MTCRIVAADLVDVARNGALSPDRRARVDRHLRECRRCAARLDDERAMSAALCRLAHATGEPPAAPESERALLAAFDAEWTTPGVVARAHAWRPLAAVASIAMAAGVVWMIARPFAGVHPPRAGSSRIAASAPQVERPAAAPIAPAVHTAGRPVPRAVHRATPPGAAAISRDASAFVPWPGADTLPAFESGRLMRLDLPAAVVISLGLTPPASQTSIVRADILVGQDGLARAVRLAP